MKQRVNPAYVAQRDVREQAVQCHIKYTENWRHHDPGHLRAFIGEVSCPSRCRIWTMCLPSDQMRRRHPFLRRYKNAWPAVDAAHQAMRNKKAYRTRKARQAGGGPPKRQSGRDHVADGRLGGGRTHRRYLAKVADTN
jgi:hypothetical protein